MADTVPPLQILRTLRALASEEPSKTADSNYKKKVRGRYEPECIFGHAILRAMGRKDFLKLREGQSVDEYLGRYWGVGDTWEPNQYSETHLDRVAPEMATFLRFCRNIQEAQDEEATWETAWSDALGYFYGGSYAEAVKQLKRKGIFRVIPATEDRSSAVPAPQGV